MDNVAVLIDGFNFYHAICKHMKNVTYPKNLKWLDYDCLMRNVLLKDRPFENLKINFYTAINTFKYDNNGNPHKSIQNHKIYTNALKSKGIQIIEGKFKFRDEPLNTYVICEQCKHEQFVHKFEIQFPKDIHCVKCSNLISSENLKCIKKVEEKKTDVKIAVDLINIARDGEYNKIFLFSTDSDYIPAAEYIQNKCPNVKLIIVAPSDKTQKTRYNQKTQKLENKSEFVYNTSEFQKIGVSVHRLRLSKLINCLFEDEITLTNGKILRNPWL
jgi:uncharacterized LabA/DUF88 family protein